MKELNKSVVACIIIIILFSMCYKDNKSNQDNNIPVTNNTEQWDEQDKSKDTNISDSENDDTDIEKEEVTGDREDENDETAQQEKDDEKNYLGKNKLNKEQTDKEELGNNKNQSNKDSVNNNEDEDNQNSDQVNNLSNIVDNKYFTFNIPKGWKQIESYINKDSIGLQKTSKEGIDIVKIPMEGASEITIDKYKDMLKETFTTRPGVKLSTIEVKDSTIGKVVYVEATTIITKDIMESNIEQGLITREAIESSGGMQIYEGGLTIEEIGVYQLDGDSITTISGKVLKGGDKSETVKKIQEIIDNIVIK